MPKLASVNLLGVLLAAVALYFVGFIWYGVLFSDVWLEDLMTTRNLITPEAFAELDTAGQRAALEAAYPNANPGLSMGLGFVISLVTAFGLGFALKKMGAKGLASHIGYAAVIWLCIAVTSLAYDHVYGLKPMIGFWIDSSHLLVGFSAAAAVLSFFD